MAAYAVKTTTVSELISGMERIHMPKEVTIPLTVMFRFFPTVFQAVSYTHLDVYKRQVIDADISGIVLSGRL